MTSHISLVAAAQLVAQVPNTLWWTQCSPQPKSHAIAGETKITYEQRETNLDGRVGKYSFSLRIHRRLMVCVLLDTGAPCVRGEKERHDRSSTVGRRVYLE